MRPTKLLCAAALALAFAAPARPHAAEFYVGEPVVQENLQIVPNYLTGIVMSNMPTMQPGPDEIHLECDVHATKGEPHGFPEDAWMPYLTIRYTLTKQHSTFRTSGKLLPMTAGDGPHYANNLKIAGPGTYQLTYVIDPPDTNGFLRHVDKATGVPGWWKPITAQWNFTYPSKPKGAAAGTGK
jgi:uncharacterized protein involved in high-affinity Fe2+ transport